MNKKITKREKIFVAGSRGMVGSSVCRELLKNGYGLKDAKSSIEVVSQIRIKS